MPDATLSLATRQQQQLNVSLRMQQSIRLLQMSSMDFNHEICGALESNPFLEEPDESSAQTTVVIENSTPTGPLDPAVDPGKRRDADAAEATQAPDPFEAWQRPATGRTRSGAGKPLEVWEHTQQPVSLRGHLREQICSQPLSERERHAAGVVIETLDDDGYLRGSAAESASALQLEPALSQDELTAAIKLVQELEPAGVGARDLAECLMLQLLTIEHGRPGRRLAVELVRDGLDLLGRRDWPALQHRFDCSEAALRQAHGLIRRLDPRPGDRYADARSEHVVPDVIVVEHRGQLSTMVNPAMLPRARLNRSYVGLLRQSRAGGHVEMRHQLKEARWLLRNAEQRFTTIQRVADSIVRRQRGFFRYGEIALNPLSLREVADELGLHESTVSRATGNKYMATPRGLFEFKHFFPRELATAGGGRCSAASVRAMLKEMIQAEPAGQPLSDVVLARQLTEQGIRVARRTVAKYRNMMKLPPAEFRRMAC